MPIPPFKDYLLPVLRFSADGSEFRVGQAIDELGRLFRLTPEELGQLLSSGQQTVHANRVGWAQTYLYQAGLLERPRRAHYRITDRGRELLASGPRVLTQRDLMAYPEFREFNQVRRVPTDTQPGNAPGPDDHTPAEQLEASVQTLRESLEKELLEELGRVSPQRFEQVVIELLVAMGYGGSRADAAQALGGPGDGGIDGLIKEDPLGLDVVYIQAKRWASGSVGRPEVMQFAGALAAKRANKGVFLTTADFTKEARQFVEQIGSKIVLIDGKVLSKLMVDHNLGVSTYQTYELKRLDRDFFGEPL